MKRIVLTLAFAAIAAPVSAQVGVSIGVNQPGFYGQINIGDVPQPQVVYAQPMVIAQPPPTVVVPAQPIYLHVPPGHIKHWEKHCHEYNACNRPVYFVQEDWFNRVYLPQHGQQGGYYGDYPHHDEHWQDDDHHGHGHHHGHGDDEGHGHGHGHGHDDDQR
jgi:hypothetical protein